jgi:hypothetical protein
LVLLADPPRPQAGSISVLLDVEVEHVDERRVRVEHVRDAHDADGPAILLRLATEELPTAVGSRHVEDWSRAVEDIGARGDREVVRDAAGTENVTHPAIIHRRR